MPIVTPAGHGRLFEETEAWLAPLLERVPITRVHDVTPLDSLGLPVWAAVTPLAADLTVHAGKGTTATAARLSAIMEAIERVCAEGVARDRVRVAAYDELGAAAIEPESFDLRFETAYGPNRPISWVDAFDLIGDRACLVPLDLTISPPHEGLRGGVETNGLAAGNTYVEAIVHALYEVIERDALSEEDFCAFYQDADETRRPSDAIDPRTLPDEPRHWFELLVSRQLKVTLQDLTNDIGVPVYGATVSDLSFPGEEGELLRFEGSGADLDPARAAVRALTEAAQSHSIHMLGARDQVEVTGAEVRRPASRRRFLRATYPRAVYPFRSSDGSSGDLPEDLNTITAKLASAGFSHCAVASLTREDLDVPVVRVLMPGAANPYSHTTHRPGPRLLRHLA